MTTKRVVIALAMILFVAIASMASFVAGFFSGAIYTSTREAQTDGLITASVLTRLRDGRSDEGIEILETNLRSDFVSHWGGFRFEDSAPEVWVFGPINLGGLAFAASYLADHPGSERDEFVEQIVSCFRQPGLPDPRVEMLAHRKAIRACYDTVQ